MNKFIITTAIFGAYDSKILTKHDILNFEEFKDRFEFHLFTNQKNLKSSIWNIHYVEKLPVENDNPRSAYYYKTNPHKVHKSFKIQSPYNIWMDCSALSLNLKTLWEMCENFLNSNKNLFIQKHPGRNCIYSELEACISLSKDDKFAMSKHVNAYAQEGYPKENGLVETGFQIRNITNENFQKFQNLLWHEITTKTRRDQLSWNYCAWKLGFKDFHMFTLEEKFNIVVLVDHPNRPKAKERILCAGPWLGEPCYEEQWRDYVLEYISSRPYDKVIIGCRSESKHFYEFADKFIIDNRQGELSRNLINGNVPIFELPAVADKEIIQLNPTTEICNSFKVVKSSNSDITSEIVNSNSVNKTIHILWATIRPKIMKTTFKYWIDTAKVRDNIKIHIAVDNKKDANELKEFEDVVVVNNPKPGVTFPSFVLARNLQVKDDDIVIFASDDFFPCENWDSKLLNEFKDFNGALLVDDKLFQKSDVFTIPIMSFAALKRNNRVIYNPIYSHTYSDNELYDCLQAQNLVKNIITTNPSLYFEHRHYCNSKRSKDNHDDRYIVTNTKDAELYARRKNLSLQKKLEVCKIISFSLWGNNPKYTLGMIENARLAKYIYPTWKVRVYHDSSVPIEILQQLQILNVELIERPISDAWLGLLWRFEVAFDKYVDRFIIRDSDARLNIREKVCVDEWIESGKPFHIMRDHQYHDAFIMGGMWGAVYNFIPNFEDLYTKYVKQVIETGYSEGGRKYFNSDQIFLWTNVWNVVKDNCVAHDERFNFPNKDRRRYTVKLDDGYFVGQTYDENNEPIFKYD